MTILVLGLGNILLSDEGIGVRAVEEFTARYPVLAGVEVLDGGTSGMDLLDQIAGVRHLIVVDAVRTGRAPADLIRLSGTEVPAFFRTRVSPHQLGLSDLLATLALCRQAPETVTVIGCEPLELETRLGLSPLIAARVEPMVAMIVAELRGLGIEL